MMYCSLCQFCHPELDSGSKIESIEILNQVQDDDREKQNLSQKAVLSLQTIIGTYGMLLC